MRITRGVLCPDNGTGTIIANVKRKKHKKYKNTDPTVKQEKTKVAVKKSVWAETGNSAGKHGNRRNATLRIANGCFAGLKVPLARDRTSLGSNLDSDICLDNSLVSNEHAVITRDGNGYVIEDLNSRNGTFVGGREIHRRKLKNGDLITIGNFQLKFTFKSMKN